MKWYLFFFATFLMMVQINQSHVLLYKEKNRQTAQVIDLVDTDETVTSLSFSKWKQVQVFTFLSLRSNSLNRNWSPVQKIGEHCPPAYEKMHFSPPDFI